ncbi:hypothetical protein GGX14DRAFT_392364 [Mycena pura]|uniref:Uncharacterized protein n=1 Tax=Mycena pura TaxID=153505 RepID=A0AAD6YDZ4_9AGAR|nr:hypothetical protein GGX14DRAFT_392364 [Mycena pura]
MLFDQHWLVIVLHLQAPLLLLPPRDPGPRAALRRARVSVRARRGRGVQAVAGMQVHSQTARPRSVPAQPILLLGTGGTQSVADGQETCAVRRRAGVDADRTADAQRGWAGGYGNPCCSLTRWRGNRSQTTRHTETCAARRRAGVDLFADRAQPTLSAGARRQRWRAGCRRRASLFADRAGRQEDKNSRCLPTCWRGCARTSAIHASTSAMAACRLCRQREGLFADRRLTRSAGIRKPVLLADVAWVRAHVGDGGVQAVAGACTGGQKDTEAARNRYDIKNPGICAPQQYNQAHPLKFLTLAIMYKKTDIFLIRQF